MILKKPNKNIKGRMTFREELASYFTTPWTLDHGNFYLDCVESLNPANRELIHLLQESRKTQGVQHDS